jgi:predicted MFS family arabinose efflux permease
MHGLYLLFWVQERGLSPALVAAVLAAGDLAIMLFEVPTGWVADRWGPRASLVIGSLVQVAGLLACWLAPGVYSLILATPLIALGDAFRSGADQALLYRTCAALGCINDFRRIEARTHAVTQVCLVVLVLAGGVLVARWGFAAGWFAESLLCAVGLVLALMMEDPPPVAGAFDEEDAGGPAESWRLLMAPRLIRAVLPASVVGAAAAAASFVAQTAADASPESVTALVAALALAEAGGSMLGARPVRYVRPSALLVLAGVAVMAAVVSPVLLGPAALVLAALAGAAHPSRAAIIQALASDTVRARAASLASACDMALSTITLPLTGLFRTGR